MRRRTIPMAAVALLISGGALLAHDLFLKPTDYFVAPGDAVRFRLLNGTFDRSEGPVTWDRVLALDLIGPDGPVDAGSAGWESPGDTSRFVVRPDGAGTWVVGVSTRPRVLALGADAFNEYLEHDGIPDELEARRREGRLEDPARERYAKHVKALIQVGDQRSDGFDRELGYPAEIVPLSNPYALGPGDTLGLRILVDGEPVADQLVRAGGRNPDASRLPVLEQRSDAQGVVRFPLRRGTWYVKFIHMTRVAEDDVNYESKWATVTFAIR